MIIVTLSLKQFRRTQMDIFEKYDHNKFKPLESNNIILDFSECKYVSQLHNILRENFGLPDYYGENWDALWDCLDGLFPDRGNYTVEIRGYDSLCNNIQKYCKPMLEIFEEIHEEYPNVQFVFQP